MERLNSIPNKLNFQRLKVAKKEQLTKTVFSLEFELPQELAAQYQFTAGQYVTLKFLHQGTLVSRDYSLTSAPEEGNLSLAINNSDAHSASSSLHAQALAGSFLEVSVPRGRFTISEKPHEFRTIVAFAAGIGITPIISHLKHILRSEPRTRFFLFYGNKTYSDVTFKKELDQLQEEHKERLEIYYFYSQEQIVNPFLKGRLDEKKLELIINQYLHLDDTDEESTIWDAVDEVLICGTGDMIKSLANACFRHGIPKKNIHFELFESYNEGIYPVEKEFPLIEDIQVTFTRNNKEYETVLKNNKEKLLPQLLEQGYNVPYSCRSGLCGSCECLLEEGEVDLLENEYLTESEVERGNILPCMSIVLSRKLKINFDNI